MIAGSVFVNIALHRTETAVGQLFKRFRQEQAQAKARQNREYRVFLCSYVDIKRSVAVNCPTDHSGKNPLQRRRRNGIARLNLHAAVLFPRRRLIRTRHGAVVLRTHPGILDIAVIVCRRTPDVQLHRAVEQILVGIAHFLEQAGELIIGIAELIRRYSQEMIILFPSERSRSLRVLHHRFCFLVLIVFRLHRNFFKTKLELLRHQLCRMFLIPGNLQRAFSLLRHCDFQRNCRFASSPKIQHCLIRDLTALRHLTVHKHLIAEHGVVLQVYEIHIVFDAQCTVLGIKFCHTHRAMYIFKLHQSRMRGAVRINESIHAEISIMRVLVVVAAVCVHFPALDRFSHINCMVAPLPDEAAAHLLLAVNQLEVVLEISRSVSHRMAVFAHDIRLVPVLDELFFDLLQRRIHAAVKINVAVIILLRIVHIPRRLVVGQTCRIKGFRPF